MQLTTLPTPTADFAKPQAAPAASALQATKTYGRGDNEVRALDGVDIDFARSRFTAIMGPSGSGKSTLMHCVAGLDTLTTGHVFIGDTRHFYALERLWGDAPLLSVER